MSYPKGRMSLVIMDTFEKQDNNDLRELCTKNNCECSAVFPPTDPFFFDDHDDFKVTFFTVFTAKSTIVIVQIERYRL